MSLADDRAFVFAHRPALGRLFSSEKNKTWIDYAREHFTHMNREVHPVYAKRFGEFAHACQTVCEPVFGTEFTRRILSTLKSQRFLSTADHHGVLCHPFFLNATILRSIYEPDEPIITFGCGGVSFSNSSYPRGIFFHDSDLNRIKIPFVPWRDRMLPVYGHSPLSALDIDHIESKGDAANIPQAQKHILHTFFDAVRDHALSDSLTTISDQYSLISQILWKMSDMSSDLAYIEIESVMRQLLLHTHLDQDTFIHRMIFDRDCRDAYITHFTKVTGAHAHNTHGTHLFWYIDRVHARRVALFAQKTTANSYVLQSLDQSVTIALDPDTIRKNILDHSLLPCLALCYSTISFYYGFTLGGGFSQIDYLGDMKKAYRDVTQTVGADEDCCDDIQTNVFTGEFVVAGVSDHTHTQPASLVDMLLWSGKSTQPNIVKLFDALSIAESLDLMMPEFKRIVSPKSDGNSDAPIFPASVYVT
ncbi:MAG: hypothetical protein WCO78_04715 [Candidatus Roizmanbacteria bacterium]